MPHGLIVGPSECGKSTKARELLKAEKAAGRKLVGFARRDIEAWRLVCDAVTSSRDQLLAWYRDPRNFNVSFFMDDAGKTVGRYDPDMVETAQEGRHGGHRFFYMAQAATTLNKDIRRNCKFLWMFKQSQEDCDVLAREFIHPELRLGVHLGRYQYLFCEKGFGPVRRGETKP